VGLRVALREVMMRGAIVIMLVACAGSDMPRGDDGAGDANPGVWDPPMGASYDPDGTAVVFRIASARATRIELAIYDAPMGAERERVVMEREPNSDVWRMRLPVDDLPSTIYYGYRIWGPNWTYDAAWTPGSELGFVADVDRDGNRMNPNKLVFDPYARELSHDPTTPEQPDYGFYGSGTNRARDSGPVAPKGIVLRDEAADIGTKPARPFRDEIIYEVHLRGLSMEAGVDCAGTYAGAATRAKYLADLGVTAVEFLPVQETPNDRNDVDPLSSKGDNYWGYSTLAFFAPDRRYACDRSPGGPTREWRAMVRAFHEHGIKVYIDVVYNHTSEGSGGSLLSLRGVDNAGYYQLDRNGTGFTNSNGVGADIAGQKPLAQALVLDSLRYWRDAMGVDGYRFDLAPILGNACVQCFDYEPDFLGAIADAIGGDLIAEPWGVVAGSYQVGNFPAGWSEWNDRYRDLIRQAQNQVGVAQVTPGWLAARIHGSSELFRPDGRPPSASVNFLVAHDGLTLHDLYACDAPNNAQAWPYGPSDGGSTDNKSWDHNGDVAAQRQAARTGFALLMLSQGVPMIVGGDERLRSQRCNNNPYNLDSSVSWLDWSEPEPQFTTFARRMMQFRSAHAAFRPAAWIEPAQISWRDATGSVASGAYMDDASRPVLAWRLDGAALGDVSPALYVAYNRGTAQIAVTLPPPPAGLAWYRVADTGAWMEPQANIAAPGSEYRMNQSRYDLAARSLALFIAR
jgi:glycogen operon protein